MEEGELDHFFNEGRGMPSIYLRRVIYAIRRVHEIQPRFRQGWAPVSAVVIRNTKQGQEYI